MQILLTGATGYIGKRLLPSLLQNGHTVHCIIRDKSRFKPPKEFKDKVHVHQHDFVQNSDSSHLPKQIDAAYYLMHSMSATRKDFSKLEKTCAENFVAYVDNSNCQQIIYLSGIDHSEELSEHLSSRNQVAQILKQAKPSYTILKAGIIIGSGSASFEIIRDIVEKLPIMVAPKWLNTRCQPIAIRNVIEYLVETLHKKECLNDEFEIGGPDVLTYKEMLMVFAEVRGLKRFIFTVPVMTPRLSSYWLYFVTSTTFNLAMSLVDSMKVDVVCKENRIQKLISTDLYTYREAIKRAFTTIAQRVVTSSWKDSFISSDPYFMLEDYLQVPEHGCFQDKKQVTIPDGEEEECLARIWSIGGNKGWYYASFLWKIRGYLDKLVGGIGLRRGRTNASSINDGDSIDFWRVIRANKEDRRLLLYAEMKLPGEAWLEFRIKEEGNKSVLHQVATFRPQGVGGRLYWWMVSPFHFFVFSGMAQRIAMGSKRI